MLKRVKELLETDEYQAALAEAYQKWDRYVSKMEQVLERDPDAYSTGQYPIPKEPCPLCEIHNREWIDTPWDEQERLTERSVRNSRCICALDRPRQVEYAYNCHKLFGDALDEFTMRKQLAAAIKLRDLIGSYMK